VSPREPGPARTTSRFRSRSTRCALGPGYVADVPLRSSLACGDDDAHLVNPGHPTSLARIIGGPLNPWDAGAADRASVSAELAAWPMPAWTEAPRVRYAGRRNVEPPPLRQRDVSGDLAAALADIAPAPQWVDPVTVLARVRAVVESPERITRADVRRALEGL